MTLRQHFALAFATLLVVFFVYPLDNVRSNYEFSPDSSPQSSQNADSNDDADLNGRAGFNVFNDSAWIRLERDENDVVVRLATSVVRFDGEFQADDGTTRSVQVDLIGAIHIADPDYYAELNKTFQQYDAVVFEMIVGRGVDFAKTIAAEKEQKREISANPLNAISFLQTALGDALDLEHQIEGIDYTAENLKRGDAFAEDFLREILSNGDVPQFFADTFWNSLFSKGGGQAESWALAVLLAKEKRTVMRRLFAKELLAEDFAPKSDEQTDERENALIHFRNKFAIQALREELSSGKTKTAVFYGAAHLPDLCRRLEMELGLTRDPNPRWIPAWSVPVVR